jgi:hypothetical protein
MAKAFQTWTILKHGPLEKISENLWRLEGNLGDTNKRVMTLARLADGRVLIHNAIALEDPLMDEITAWGTPAGILVPNAFHRQDAKIMKDRFPNAKVYCPGAAKKAVSQVVAVDGSYDDVPRDATVSARHIDGINEKEGVLEVNSSDGRSLVFCDTLLNVKDPPLLFKFFLAPVNRPSVPRFAKWFFMKNKAALKADLEKMAAADGLRRIIPGHGAMVASDAATILSGAAREI